MIRGNCFCGRCSYLATGDLVDVLHCHCTICRKLTGSAFSTYAGVSHANFKWLCDTTSMNEYKSSERVSRFLCSTCGSLVASIDYDEKNTIYLTAGLINTNTKINVEYHQFVSSKVSWFEIEDDLPQYKHGA